MVDQLDIRYVGVKEQHDAFEFLVEVLVSRLHQDVAHKPADPAPLPPEVPCIRETIDTSAYYFNLVISTLLFATRLLAHRCNLPANRTLPRFVFSFPPQRSIKRPQNGSDILRRWPVPYDSSPSYTVPSESSNFDCCDVWQCAPGISGYTRKGCPYSLPISMGSTRRQCHVIGAVAYRSRSLCSCTSTYLSTHGILTRWHWARCLHGTVVTWSL